MDISKHPGTWSTGSSPQDMTARKQQKPTLAPAMALFGEEGGQFSHLLHGTPSVMEGLQLPSPEYALILDIDLSSLLTIFL